MLKVNDCISPHGQTSLLINSIIAIFLFLAQPISTAEEDTGDSDELYTSSDYDSEYDDDKAPIDIRPLRDSRKKYADFSTDITPSVSGDGYTLPSGKGSKTTVASEEAVTENTELYRGTFKNVHNREDFNYSVVTLPTIVGTLFTVDLAEWKKSKNVRKSKPVKLLDPSMIKLFSPRPNYTHDAEYRTFVLWANRQYKRNQSITTVVWTTTEKTTSFTLYPKEFDNNTAFQQYISKNWVNNSLMEHRYTRGKSMNGSDTANAWIDKIAKREFYSMPWRNKNASDSASWRGRHYVRGNRSNYEYFQRGFSRRRPHYFTGDGNETDFGPRSWRDRSNYYWTVENNRTVMKDLGPQLWRRRRPEGNETITGEWRERYNETEPMDLERRPWKEHPRYPGPWIDGPGPKGYGPPMDMDPREFEHRFDQPPPQHPPRGHDFEPRDYIDGRDYEQYEPPRGFDGRYESREFYSREQIDRHHDYQPTENGSIPKDLGERIPPSGERDSDDRRAKFDDVPSRRQRPDRFDNREFDEKRPPQGREQFDERPPREKESSREKDFDGRGPQRGRQEYDERREQFDERPPRKEESSREKDFDGRGPQRGKQEYDERREQFDERPPRKEESSREKDFDGRGPQRGRQEYDERPSRDRDSDDRGSQRSRQEFDGRPSRDGHYEGKGGQRSRQEFESRPYRDRGSQRGRQEFEDRGPQRDRQDYSIRHSTNRSSSEDVDSSQAKNRSEAHSRPYERREYQKDRGTRWSTKGYSSYRKTDRYQSISRTDRDFYNDRNRATGQEFSTTENQLAVHAKFYRQRIEQRREKEIQKLDKKRKKFWKPTASGEATVDDADTTTTIKTTIRRSYAKGKKMKDVDPEATPEAGYWIEDESESQDPYMNVTHPYNEEYMRQYGERQETERITDKYDWITPVDPNQTTQLRVVAPHTDSDTGTATSPKSSSEDEDSKKDGKKEKKSKFSRPLVKAKKITKGSKKTQSKKKKKKG